MEEKTKRLMVTFKPATVTALKNYCATNGVTMAEVIRAGLRLVLAGAKVETVQKQKEFPTSRYYRPIK